MEKKNYPKWAIRQAFTKVKFINDSNLSPPTIKTIGVPQNENKTTKKAYVTSTL